VSSKIFFPLFAFLIFHIPYRTLLFTATFQKYQKIKLGEFLKIFQRKSLSTQKRMTYCIQTGNEVTIMKLNWKVYILNPPDLVYTQGKIKYKISDLYCVKTTWERGKNKWTVRCSINYIDNKPLFQIMYGINFSEEIHSNTSSTSAANAVLRVSICY